MIYIDNNEETQVVFIPRGAVKIGVAPPVNEETLSDYYTKNQVNGLLQSYPTRTETESIVNEAVKDIDLKDYYTKEEVDDKLEDVGVPEIYEVTCGRNWSLSVEEVKTLARRASEGLPSRVLLDGDLDFYTMDVQGIYLVDGENEGYKVWGLYNEFDVPGFAVYSWELLKDNGVISGLDENGRVKVYARPQLPTDLSGYQEKLVSSQNIKTVNGQSLLGPGNITIEGGSGSIPHFVFTLDGENGKANLLQGDPEQLIELALGHGQFTAMLFTGDSCVDYTSVDTENSSVTVNFETQEDYIFIFLESGGIKFSGDFPVQTIEKLKMWGIFDRLAEKQDKLVSGKNIKTINGESLLGNGDITIEGGTVDADSLEQAITDSPYISAILARLENLEDRVDEIEENNNNMVSEL